MKQRDLRTVKILCILVIPLLLLCQTPSLRLVSGKCSRVLDGDTVELDYGRKKLRLRLAMIDAPESKQLSFDKRPIGKESKLYLEGLVLNKRIDVEIIQKDRYGRYLAIIRLNEEDINLKMVEEGHALIYRYYEFQSVKQKLTYLTTEIIAKRKRVGMWSSYGFHDPYVYRRIKK